jgi:hypothetical protein
VTFEPLDPKNQEAVSSLLLHAGLEPEDGRPDLSRGERVRQEARDAFAAGLLTQDELDHWLRGADVPEGIQCFIALRSGCTLCR